MTEGFEKWWLTKFSAEFLDSDNCWSAWTGWQARGELDAVKIKELEVENHALGLIIDNEDKELADKVAELTAKLDKAREALSMASWNNIGGYEGQQRWLELNRELDK